MTATEKVTIGLGIVSTIGAIVAAVWLSSRHTRSVLKAQEQIIKDQGQELGVELQISERFRSERDAFATEVKTWRVFGEILRDKLRNVNVEHQPWIGLDLRPLHTDMIAFLELVEKGPVPTLAELEEIGRIAGIANAGLMDPDEGDDERSIL